MSSGGGPPIVRVILVDDEASRTEMVREALVTEGYNVVATFGTGADLLQRVQELSPDIIIVDIDSPDRDTLEGMGRVIREHGRPVVMFAQDGSVEVIRAAVEAGVSAYVVDGLTPERVRPVVDVAIARFAHFQKLRNELDKANASLADRKVVEKAKGILMKRRGCDEEEAHRTMRKMAMDQKLKLVDIARKIIDAAALLG